jgi:hypothetical protein
MLVVVVGPGLGELANPDMDTSTVGLPPLSLMRLATLFLVLGGGPGMTSSDRGC